MKKSKYKILLLSCLLLIIGYTWINYHNEINLQQVISYVEESGDFAPFIFVLGYAICTVLFLPGLALTIAGGFLFGVLHGTLLNLCGAMFGASVAFILARYIAKDWVANKAGNRMQALHVGINGAGWKFIAVVRLMPILPFNLLNYALGVTRIKFITYFIASMIFMLPGTLLYTFIGVVANDTLVSQNVEYGKRILFAIGILLLVLSIPWIVKTLNVRQED